MKNHPGFADSGIIGRTILPGSNQQLIFALDAGEFHMHSYMRIVDATTWKTIQRVEGVAQLDTFFFRNDSLYLRVFSFRDSIGFTVRYGVDELHAGN